MTDWCAEQARKVVNEYCKKEVWTTHLNSTLIEQLIAAALTQAVARGLTWTDQKPDKPGWYWYRTQRQSTFHPPFDAIVHVNFQPQDAPMVSCGNDWRYLSDCPGQWAGPIQPPADTQEGP